VPVLTADVIVIGAGICGASTALGLARQGRQVTIVDQAAGPGLGTTGASSAIVRFNYSTWEGVVLSWESRLRWERWGDQVGDDPAGLPRLVRCGLVCLDVELVSLPAMTAMFDRARIPYEHWDSEMLQARLPGIDVGRYFPPQPVDSDAFFAPAHSTLGALYTPDAGYISDPQLATSNLVAAAVRHGAQTLFRRTVVGVDHIGEHWEVALSDGQRLRAPIVVNAAGPWSPQINRLAGVGTDFRVTQRALRQEVHRVQQPESLRKLGEELPVIVDLDLGVYLRADSGGGLLVGGTEPECDPLDWVNDLEAVDYRPTLGRHEAQVLRAAKRFPDLAVPARPQGIVGLYDVASDWIPIYDRTDRDGFFVAIGTSGNQFKNAPVIGNLMAHLITEVHDHGVDHDRQPVQFRAELAGFDVNVGAFSRLREPNPDSSGTVMG
jgi:sarcosine oxidase, subunit beta